MKYLITGGAGFIGSALSRLLGADAENRVVILDKLTYAGSLGSLHALKGKRNVRFVEGDIRDRGLISSLLAEEKIETIIHLAAETHVDRSIDSPAVVMDTNVMGTLVLLEAALAHWRTLAPQAQQAFRFHHVSTDEVFGDLGPNDLCFTEETPYAPSSPYSASKAAADHLVRAWHRTYGLPVVLTNCSNNHGPFQFPEKLIPSPSSMRFTARLSRSMAPAAMYAIGCMSRITRAPWPWLPGPGASVKATISAARRNVPISPWLKRSATFSIAASRKPPARPIATSSLSSPIGRAKIRTELGWTPSHTISSGIENTIEWYLQNSWWWQPIRDTTYQGERFGLERSRSSSAADSTPLTIASLAIAEL